VETNKGRPDSLTAALVAASLSVSFGAMAGQGQANTGTVQIAPAHGSLTQSKRTSEMTTIKLSFDGGEALVELNDNPSTRDLVSMLPLTLMFSDYNSIEKIAYPPRKLSVASASFGLSPSAGDFALYAPWGNLVAYYRDFRHSDDLIHLGRFTSGLEQLASMDGEFSVRVEAEK
jgi:hypothetical protein